MVFIFKVQFVNHREAKLLVLLKTVVLCHGFNLYIFFHSIQLCFFPLTTQPALPSLCQQLIMRTTPKGTLPKPLQYRVLRSSCGEALRLRPIPQLNYKSSLKVSPRETMLSPVSTAPSLSLVVKRLPICNIPLGNFLAYLSLSQHFLPLSLLNK